MYSHPAFQNQNRAQESHIPAAFLVGDATFRDDSWRFAPKCDRQQAFPLLQALPDKKYRSPQDFSPLNIPAAFNGGYSRNEMLLATAEEQFRELALAARAAERNQRVAEEYLRLLNKLDQQMAPVQERERMVLSRKPQEPQEPERVCLTKPVPMQWSSSRVNLKCDTPEEIVRTLKVLGTTLRSKADPFIDVSVFKDPGVPRCVRGGICELFPDKLHRMLSEIEQSGESDIISFLPHGRAFAVHNMKKFLEVILPRYFREQTKWSSFSRQLNLYGFSRISSGPDSGAYYHELFLKGRPNLCHYMRRVGAPTGVDRRRFKVPEGDDPDFNSMVPIHSDDVLTSRSARFY